MGPLQNLMVMVVVVVKGSGGEGFWRWGGGRIISKYFYRTVSAEKCYIAGKLDILSLLI